MGATGWSEIVRILSEELEVNLVGSNANVEMSYDDDLMSLHLPIGELARVRELATGMEMRRSVRTGSFDTLRDRLRGAKDLYEDREVTQLR